MRRSFSHFFKRATPPGFPQCCRRISTTASLSSSPSPPLTWPLLRKTSSCSGQLPCSDLASNSRIVISDALEHKASSNTHEKNANSFCTFYKTLKVSDKVVFLKILAKEYHVNQDDVLHQISALQSCQDQRNVSIVREERLRSVLNPRFAFIFSQIAHLEGGVKFLVDMRADLLNILSTRGIEQDDPYLKALDRYLREVLSMWFSVGLMQLERVTWESPCDMLQKISEYEAVHPMRNWSDLKRRVGSYRRCFVFTHSSMPKEPIVVLHTALTNEISSSIQSIVQSEQTTSTSEDTLYTNSRVEDTGSIGAAVFYSITSTQKGLQGVELGNYLIKRVVNELLAEFPRMNQFSSLSPIPGFRDWLIGEINKELHLREIGETFSQVLLTSTELLSVSHIFGNVDQHHCLECLKKSFLSNSWTQNKLLLQLLQPILMRLCARYLYNEKRRGYALNPVANFHLRNGSVMWRLNWLGDTSPRGLGASLGLMVNYRYYLKETERNSQIYIEQMKINASEQILGLIKTLPNARDTKSNL